MSRSGRRGPVGRFPKLQHRTRGGELGVGRTRGTGGRAGARCRFRGRRIPCECRSATSRPIRTADDSPGRKLLSSTAFCIWRREGAKSGRRFMGAGFRGQSKPAFGAAGAWWGRLRRRWNKPAIGDYPRHLGLHTHQVSSLRCATSCSGRAVSIAKHCEFRACMMIAEKPRRRRPGLARCLQVPGCPEAHQPEVRRSMRMSRAHAAVLRIFIGGNMQTRLANAILIAFGTGRPGCRCPPARRPRRWSISKPIRRCRPRPASMWRYPRSRPS